MFTPPAGSSKDKGKGKAAAASASAMQVDLQAIPSQHCEKYILLTSQKYILTITILKEQWLAMVMISCHLPTVSILIPVHIHHLHYAYVKNIPVNKLSIPRQTHALNTPPAPQPQTSHKPSTREEEYIWILSSDKALLNDTCINNCTALLYSIHISASHILSSHNTLDLCMNSAVSDTMPLTLSFVRIQRGHHSGKPPYGYSQFISQWQSIGSCALSI